MPSARFRVESNTFRAFFLLGSQILSCFVRRSALNFRPQKRHGTKDPAGAKAGGGAEALLERVGLSLGEGCRILCRAELLLDGAAERRPAPLPPRGAASLRGALLRGVAASSRGVRPWRTPTALGVAASEKASAPYLRSLPSMLSCRFCSLYTSPPRGALLLGVGAFPRGVAARSLRMLLSFFSASFFLRPRLVWALLPPVLRGVLTPRCELAEGGRVLSPPP